MITAYDSRGNVIARFDANGKYIPTTYSDPLGYVWPSNVPPISLPSTRPPQTTFGQVSTAVIEALKVLFPFGVVNAQNSNAYGNTPPYTPTPTQQSSPLSGFGWILVIAVIAYFLFRGQTKD